MTISPEWVHKPEPADLLQIKSSTLRNMRRERRLDTGAHWVYATGSISGPVVYASLQLGRCSVNAPSKP